MSDPRRNRDDVIAWGKQILAGIKERKVGDTPDSLQKHMALHGFTAADLDTTESELSEIRKGFVIWWAKKLLAWLEEDADCASPVALQNHMTRHGLTSADLDTTEIAINELRKRHGIRWAKQGLAGLKAFAFENTPEWLREHMAIYSLAPEDFDATETEIAEAERLYNIHFAKKMLTGLKELDPDSPPGLLQNYMKDYGLTPEDLATTDGEIAKLRKAYRKHFRTSL